MAPFTNRTPVQTLTRNAEDVRAIAFDPSSKFLATGHRDKHVRVWDIEDGLIVWESDRDEMHRDKVMCLAFAGEGNLLASGSFDNTIKIWNIQGTGEPVQTLRGHSASIHQLPFSQDNRTLFSAGGDRTVRLWDMQSHQEKFQIGGHSREAHGIALSADEDVLATAGVTGVRLWYGSRDAN